MDAQSPEPLRRRKQRSASIPALKDESEPWDCTVCTFRNSPEAFSCKVCHVRKGTSTRKPKLNRQIVEEQNLIARTIKERQEEFSSATAGTSGSVESSSHHRRKYHRHNPPSGAASTSDSSHKNVPPLRPSFPSNFDRSYSNQYEVFANGFAVTITEYLPKGSPCVTPISSKQAYSMPDSPPLSTPSSLLGFSNANGTTKMEKTSSLPEQLTEDHNLSPVSANEHSNNANSDNGALDLIKKEDAEVKDQTKTRAKRHQRKRRASPPPEVEEENGETEELSIDSSASTSSTSLLERKRRRKHRLRSVTSVNASSNTSRSLRSSTGSATASRSRQASRIARVSLYRTQRSYKRRKVAHVASRSSGEKPEPEAPFSPPTSILEPPPPPPPPSTVPVNASVSEEAALMKNELSSPGKTESTLAMTDICGASGLEISTASAASS